MAAAFRRTFEARQHPKGSAERARLNTHPLTSEYMTSYRYVVLLADGKPYKTYTTKAAAEAALPDVARKEA